MASKLCRICMISRGKMINIFKHNLGGKVANEFLMQFCDVKVIEGDGLPKEICLKCLRGLKATYKFKIQCELTDKLLKSKILEEQCKVKEGCSIPASIKLENINLNNDFQEQMEFNDAKNSMHSSLLKDVSTNEKWKNSEQMPPKTMFSMQHKLDEITDISISCYKSNSTLIPTSIIEQPLIKKIKARKNATCPVCYQKFEDYEDYRIHVRKHSGEVEKPYKCKACSKGFLCISQLNRHIFTHSDVKLYECSVCGKGFNNAAHMKSHMYVHTGERPYSCSICNKGFNQMPHLKRHMQSHIRCEKS